MPTTNLKALVGKLNTPCRRALEAAAGLCVSRTNYNVELEHWLLKLAESTDGDLPRVFKHYGVDPSRAARELTKSLDGLKTGNARGPELSAEVVDLMHEAWAVASLDYGAARVRSGYLLAALLADRTLGARARAASPELAKIPADQLARDVKAVVGGTAEDAPEPGEAAPGEAARPPADSKTPSLDQFTYDLTAQARAGKLDAVIGRDGEIAQMIDILTRRRQNNPILTGEAGVGKTAVVEGFALKVVAGDVPPPLRGVSVRVLDLALLQAGAGVKGEFENRLKGVIQEVKASPVPVILFIDEAHTLIGAGGSAGQGDAANLLKPALARGELRTVAATTRMEYKKYFEGDPALKRRFQEVKVDEPTVDLGVRMMRGIAGMLEKHHAVRILDEAVAEAVRLSHRYITDRQLPDKSVSLLDTACAKVALSQSATPAQLLACRREVEHAEAEIRALEREQIAGGAHDARLAELREAKTAAEAREKELETRLAGERALAGEVRALREKLEAHAAGAEGAGLSAGDLEAARNDYTAKAAALAELQGEHPLVQPVVTAQAVAEVVAGWTGIPVGKMVRNEIDAVLKLTDRLAERVVGQPHALEALAQRIQTSRAGLADPRRPLGVFLLVGPSGVGKTETAITLAETLYGGDRNLITINMSEYKEDHKISRLTGSAPGYVGYGEGGVLTEAVRRKPYSVVLLDEVEKANESVQEIFYQVFDKGMLQDDKGNEINFKNTIILLTSNAGTDTIMKVCADPDTRPDADGLAAALRPDLLKAFKPALLGRMTVVPYFPLGDEVLRNIIRLQLKRIADRVRLNHRAEFAYDEALVDTVIGRCKEVESGARNVDHILTGTLLPELSREFLGRMAEGRPVTRARVGVTDGGRFTYEVS
ncbi:type VI secretion system ATPase TssH [bacterium]|nr:type VI secretion system ATPase TssH [bacterium]